MVFEGRTLNELSHFGSNVIATKNVERLYNLLNMSTVEV